VHAYVLMTNHVHLLVTPPDAEGFSLMMRDINQVFVQHVNRHNHRCGTTWQGRPKTFAVDSESYFLTCQRYVEENPVRARMVEHPSSYPWSSFAINALGGSSTFITPHPAYLRLGSTPEERQKAYRSLFHTAMGDEVLAKIRTSVNGGWPLGTDAFLDQVEKAFGIKAAPGRAGRPKKKK
jgi:putative transposase